jgi:hypothetical protein
MVGEEFDVHNQIITFDQSELTTDLLYDLATELSATGSDAFAARVEMERHNATQDESYRPSFLHDSVTGIAITLLVSRVTRELAHEDHRIRLGEEIGRIFATAVNREVSTDVVQELELEAIEVVDGSDLDVFSALTGEQAIQFNQAYVNIE